MKYEIEFFEKLIFKGDNEINARREYSRELLFFPEFKRLFLLCSKRPKVKTREIDLKYNNVFGIPGVI